MKSSYFLYTFYVLLLLCSSVQVVSAESASVNTTQWNGSGVETGQISSPDDVAMAASAVVNQTSTAQITDPYPVMHPNQTTLQRWIEQYKTAEPVQIDQTIRNRAIQSTGSRSLLSDLPYSAAERNQGKIGNCWVWAGTGVLEVAHTKQNSIRDRLSIQYLDSNYNGGSGSEWAGEGGTVTDFVNFYNQQRIVVPWSNTKANFQDGSTWCRNNFQAWVSALSIQTTPHYDVTSISEQRIETQGVSQIMAIADIKSVLDQGKAVDLAFFLPDDDAWDDFYTFWYDNRESAVWDPSRYSGRSWDYVTGKGHAVVCVGYDDTDPNNRYWILLNSWGTANGNRPRGTFRMKMNIDYSVNYDSGYSSYYDVPATEWETISVGFSNPQNPNQITGPVKITTPGTYTLTKDITSLTGQIGIEIASSNVVIEGNGHTLDGTDKANSIGVSVHSSSGALSGVTIRNLIVTDWQDGIKYENAKGRVELVTARSNTANGIMLNTGAEGSVITGCTAESNADGISVSYGPNVEITGCTARSNSGDGIYLFASNSARVTGVISEGNLKSGIALLGSTSNRISGFWVTNCQIKSNGKAGIYMERAEQNAVYNNRFENSVNVLFGGAEVGANTWNTAKTTGSNIIGGQNLGGNWWSGFSETAQDTNWDGLSEQAYSINYNNADNLPLVTANPYTIYPGIKITTPGTYYLNQDIQNCDLVVCVEVKCSNVIIEGNGHTIDGNGQNGYCGIYVSNQNSAISGVTVRNLKVTGYSDSIYFDNAKNGLIDSCTIRDTPSGGMGLILSGGSSGNIVTNNRIITSTSQYSNTNGIVISSSWSNQIYNNELNNPTNVYFSGALYTNTWNTVKRSGTNIIGGPWLGGNFWGTPGGTGFSEIGSDGNYDGICDTASTLTTNNVDQLPLVHYLSAPLLTPGFTATPTTGAAPLTVQFTDTTTGSPTSWYWNFGDGYASSAQNPSHQYSSAGTYTVTLTANNAATGSKSTTKTGYIIVSSMLTPSFTATPTTGTAPLTVQFTDTTTGSPTSWYWNFGDGYASSAQNPSHQYSSAGTYTVTLTANNAAAGSKSITKTGFITVSASLIPSFTATPTAGTAPLTVQFTDTTTGSPTSWYWNFGDGYASGAQNPSHLYGAAGTYSVTLTVTNAASAGKSITKTGYITVTAAPVITPVADFTATPSTGAAPLAIQFTERSTNANQWSWTFGDGTTSTEQHPSHTFTTAGTYTVVLTVRNAAGQSNTKTQTNLISVTSPVSGTPVADFTATPISGVGPLTVRFTDTSTGVPTGWYWFFGDGFCAFEKNPSHTFAQAGTYTVQLYAFNAKGYFQKTKTNYITVNTVGGLTANFTTTPTSGTAPLNVQFTDTSTGGATSWSWNFGDGAASTDQSPSHTYSQAGTYTTSLTVRNSAGLTSIKEGTITVTAAQQTLQAAFTVNTQTAVVGQTVVTGTDTSTGSPTTWYWDFGDGYASSVRNINHVYTTAGSYTLSLTVTSGSQTSTTSKTITVTGDSVITPVADFTVTPLGGAGSMGILVSDTSVNAASVQYDLGDGTITSYRTFRYTYWQPGTYILKQTATSATGSSIKTIAVTVPAMNPPVSPTVTVTLTPTVSPTGTVSVTPTPTPTDQPQTGAASFTVSPTSGRKSFTAALTDTTTGGTPVSWKWNCGNGQSFSGKSVGLNRIWYNNAGTYTITLTVTDQNGSTRTASKTVTVTS